MPRIETIYQFDELDDGAKENARNWYRGCIESDELADCNDWESVATILGIQFATNSVKLMGGGTRQDPVIYWELNPTSAAFAGRYSYAKGAARKIREYAPQDAALHGIADTLQRAQSKAFYRLTAQCETGGRSGTSQKAQVYRHGDCIDNDDIESALRDFAHWIASQVAAESDYLNSDEVVDESIRANEYEFDESGNIA